MLRLLKRGNKRRATLGCGKIAYASKAKARKDQKTRLARQAGRKKPYKCGFCGLWHVTSEGDNHGA